MSKASEVLITTTWLNDDQLFCCHDEVTPINWDVVNDKVLRDDTYSDNQLTMISMLYYLDGKGTGPLASDIGQLENNERISILEALKVHWAGISLEENL